MWCGASCKIRFGHKIDRIVKESGWGTWPGADVADWPPDRRRWSISITIYLPIGGSDAVCINGSILNGKPHACISSKFPICVLAENAGTYGHFAVSDKQTSCVAFITVGIPTLSFVANEAARFEANS